MEKNKKMEWKNWAKKKMETLIGNGIYKPRNNNEYDIVSRLFYLSSNRQFHRDTIGYGKKKKKRWKV